MKALVTGAAGFIGSTLAERLQREGADVGLAYLDEHDEEQRLVAEHDGFPAGAMRRSGDGAHRGSALFPLPHAVGDDREEDDRALDRLFPVGLDVQVRERGRDVRRLEAPLAPAWTRLVRAARER